MSLRTRLQGDTVLHLAVNGGHTEVVETVLKASEALLDQQNMEELLNKKNQVCQDTLMIQLRSHGHC